MKLEIEPFPSCLGAEVRGIDLSQPLTGDNRAALEAAIARHAVLVVRGQPLAQ